MVKHTFKILQQMLQDFQSAFDYFGTLCIKGLKTLKEWTGGEGETGHPFKWADSVYMHLLNVLCTFNLWPASKW